MVDAARADGGRCRSGTTPSVVPVVAKDPLPWKTPTPVRRVRLADMLRSLVWVDSSSGRFEKLVWAANVSLDVLVPALISSVVSSVVEGLAAGQRAASEEDDGGARERTGVVSLDADEDADASEAWYRWTSPRAFPLSTSSRENRTAVLEKYWTVLQ